MDLTFGAREGEGENRRHEGEMRGLSPLSSHRSLDARWWGREEYCKKGEMKRDRDSAAAREKK